MLRYVWRVLFVSLWTSAAAIAQTAVPSPQPVTIDGAVTEEPRDLEGRACPDSATIGAS
jgi:hypothetical protein